jgi:hypothetical protein
MLVQATNMKRTAYALLALFTFWCLVLAGSARAQWNPLNPVMQVQQQPDGVLFTMQAGVLKLQVCSPAVIRVLYSPTSSFPLRHSSAS